MPLSRVGQSLLINATDVGGSPEFYLKAMLKPGAKYSFTYLRRGDADTKYRYDFTAPSAKTRMQRVNFKRVG